MQNGDDMIKDALESLCDSLAYVKDLEESPIAELPPIIDQIRMELEHAKANIQPILENNFHPEGHWQKTSPGYYLWTGPNDPNTTCSLTIFGQQFHTLAIQTKGEDEQVALHPENQAELEALHTAGGTSEGYSEIEVDGHPAVVFLVPFDR